MMPTALAALLLALPLSAAQYPTKDDSSPDDAAVDADVLDEDALDWGHSRHGEAYDEGPRQRPWIMEGIGSTPFPITTSHPEVQRWFDQGNALLHGFWWYEAERTFRWCVKLDPDCAMAYWGMARAAQVDSKRGRAFLAEAVARKDSVTPRERDFIELLEAAAAHAEARGDEAEEARDALGLRLERLLMDHPDDIEVKALYWLLSGRLVFEASGGAELPVRYGYEAVLQDILDVDPDHVGALHYRIHNWDGKEGHYAIDSCMRLSEVAPSCGHLQHMPGHVLSGIGLWHEAAIAMDSATRVEKTYMRERMILPEENWDYVHNLDYLCYIQEQLGMADAAVLGAQQLLLAPTASEPGRMMGTQRMPILRALLKFERWEEVVAGELFAWDAESDQDALARAYAETHAHLGLGDLDAAEESLDAFREALAAEGRRGPPDLEDMPRVARVFAERMRKAQDLRLLELEGLLAIEKGEGLKGIEQLNRAAELQEETWSNDPPHQAYFVFNLLGERLLDLGSPGLAAEAFERTLETVFHDGFALSGLVRAYHALGDAERAQQAMGALAVVWSDADQDNRWLAAARATGVQPAAELAAEFAFPAEQRSYRLEVYDELGPSLWIPSAAPELAALDAHGETVTLDDYEDRSVLLIFYLGDECLHCMEQIAEAEARFDALQELGCDVVAVSKDSVAELRAYEDSDEFRITLLSDPEFENAVRYGAYDDFEEIELHSTVLIDARGRVHWATRGGDPFMEFDWLESEARRLHEGGLVHELLTAEAAGG